MRDTNQTLTILVPFFYKFSRPVYRVNKHDAVADSDFNVLHLLHLRKVKTIVSQLLLIFPRLCVRVAIFLADDVQPLSVTLPQRADDNRLRVHVRFRQSASRVVLVFERVFNLFLFHREISVIIHHAFVSFRDRAYLFASSNARVHAVLREQFERYFLISTTKLRHLVCAFVGRSNQFKSILFARNILRRRQRLRRFRRRAFRAATE